MSAVFLLLAHLSKPALGCNYVDYIEEVSPQSSNPLHYLWFLIEHLY